MTCLRAILDFQTGQERTCSSLDGPPCVECADVKPPLEMMRDHRNHLLSELEKYRALAALNAACLKKAEAENERLRDALTLLVEYVEDNAKYIPLRMDSKNTGAMQAARKALERWK